VKTLGVQYLENAVQKHFQIWGVMEWVKYVRFATENWPYFENGERWG